MELRKGYKQTEVGVIPEDWVLRPIGSFSTIYGRIGFRGYTKKDIVSEGQGAIALNPSNIQGNKLVLDGCTYVTWEKYHESPEIKIQEGDVILVKTGSTTGKTCYVDRLPIEATLNPQMIVFKKMSVNQRLIGYVFASPVFQNQLTATVVGGALPTLSQKQVAGYKIPLPSTEVEQRAIATALSDVDALLDGLDRLIAKKRDLKQAAMQELLTGETRLPGFEGEWEKAELKLLVEKPITDGPHMTPRFLDNGVPFLSVNNLVNNRIDLSDLRYISNADDQVFAKKCKPRRGDILLGKAASVGKVAIVEDDIDFNIWSPIALVRVSKRINAKFLYYQLQGAACVRQIELLTNSSSQGNIGMGDIEKLQISFPSTPEQVTIATILSDMDAEIAALEQRRNKTKDIKQAMMQELLTGKTRLVTPGGSNA